MSSEVTTAFVQQYSANVFHLSQQKGSRFQSAVRNESQKSKSSFYDRIGSVTAQLRTGRHADTPQMDTPHSRRMVTLGDYEYADLVDDADKLRMLNDPTSDYAIAAMWALGRAKDDVIIAAASGNAYGGETGGTTVALGTGQEIHAVSAAALSTLNVATLRLTKRIFDSADIDPSITRYFALKSYQLSSLLAQTEVTSSDFNSIKALVQGEVDTFLGFKFIRSERLGTLAATNIYSVTTGLYDAGGTAATGYTRCLAWASDGLLLATAQEAKARIGERADKSYSNQVYCSMGIGATRMEEAKVLSVGAKDS
jgi:hypothetical protein